MPYIKHRTIWGVLLFVLSLGLLTTAVALAAAGNISTVAGDGTQGFSGDGGAATSAQLDFPHAVAVGSSGNLFIADSSNHRIRKVDTSGNISTVAGNGTAGFSGDGGPATSARLDFPLASRWTPSATSSSLTMKTTASARWTPRGTSAPWRAM